MINPSTPAYAHESLANESRLAGAPSFLPIQADVRRVIILTYPGCFLGETIKLLELLIAINDFAVRRGEHKIHFAIQFYSLAGGRVPSPSSRLIHMETLTVRGPIPVETDLIIIAHGTRASAAEPSDLLSHWLRAVCPGARQIVALGSGVLRMAAAGLLDNRRATTHSLLAPYLAAHYPQVIVNALPALQIDGNILTTSENINLRQLAQLLLNGPLPLTRPLAAPGGAMAIEDSMPVIARIFTRSDSIAQRITIWWLRHLEEDVSMDCSALYLSMSERSFRRHFKLEVGYSPYLFLLLLRLELARQALLDSDLPIDKIARRGGLHDGQQLARMFRKFIGVSPNQYRAKCEGGQAWPTDPAYAALFDGHAIPPWLRELQCIAAAQAPVEA